MDEGILTDQKDEELIQQLINVLVSPRGYKDIRANLEDYETPAKLTRQNKKTNEDESFIPDVTAVINGRKSYFELAVKSDDVTQVVTKWKLLSDVARYKRGKLFLVTPRGHFAFADRLMKLHMIQAEVVKL